METLSQGTCLLGPVEVATVKLQKGFWVTDSYFKYGDYIIIRLGVSERKADWAGVSQDLNPTTFVEEPLTYWFNFSLQRNGHVPLNVNWKINVETNGESQYFSLLNVDVLDSEWHDYGEIGQSTIINILGIFKTILLISFT